MQNFMNLERYCRCRKLNESLRLIQRFLNVTFESQDTEFGPQTVHLRVLFTRRRFKLPFVQIFTLFFSFPHPWFWYILGLFKLHHISLVFPYCIITSLFFPIYFWAMRKNNNNCRGTEIIFFYIMWSLCLDLLSNPLDTYRPYISFFLPSAPLIREIKF